MEIKTTQKVRSRQVKIISTTTPDRQPQHSYPCVLISLRPRVNSRVVEVRGRSLRVALSGAEVRLLCHHFRRIYPRLKYGIPAKTRRTNLGHIPGQPDWNFKPKYTSEDRLVQIGIEVWGSRMSQKRRVVIELTPGPYSRVRCLKWSWSWMPNSTEFKTLAGMYGCPIMSPHGDLENKMQQLSRAKHDLRKMFERLHPGLQQKGVA